MQRGIYVALLIPGFLLACSDESKFKATTAYSSLPPQTAEQVPPADAVPAPVPEPTPAVTPEPGPVTSVEFGATEVFHIGDGAVGGGSSCVGEVKEYDLKGTSYFFEFEVLEDGTEIDLSIGKICGVDQVGMTTLALIDANSEAIEQAETVVPTDKQNDLTKAWSPYSTFRLAKGLYSVVVTSKNTLGKPQGTLVPGSDEYDDVIIGKINVKADKPVRASRVYAE